MFTTAGRSQQSPFLMEYGRRGRHKAVLFILTLILAFFLLENQFPYPSYVGRLEVFACFMGIIVPLRLLEYGYSSKQHQECARTNSQYFKKYYILKNNMIDFHNLSKVTDLNDSHYRKTHYMTIAGPGQLGNQFFEYAALLSTSLRLGYTPFLRSNHYLHKYIKSPYVSDIDLTNNKTFGEHMVMAYDGNILGLSTSFNWTLTGFYQSWKYFSDIESVIRTSIKLRDVYLNRACQFLEALNVRNNTIIGVHVRRFNHLDNNADAGYILRAMEYFEKTINGNDIVFIIVTHDKAWCRKNIATHGKHVVYSDFCDGGSDMALLSLCDHVIVTTGTFGWWGAWLANGTTVYFKGFPRPGTELDAVCVKEDYYPPHWIGLY